MAIKLNIGDPKSKKTVQLELDEQNSQGLMGKQIGNTFKGELVDKPGYEFEITGGSDKAGFPMRNDVEGDQRKRVLITTSVGNRKRRKGMRLRRTVAGNTIGATTVQVNAKIVKQGKGPLVEEKKEEAAEKPAEAPKEEKKEEAQEESKPEAEAPKKDVKEEKAEAPEKKPEQADEKPKEEAKPDEKAEAPKEDIPKDAAEDKPEK